MRITNHVLLLNLLLTLHFFLSTRLDDMRPQPRQLTCCCKTTFSSDLFGATWVPLTLRTQPTQQTIHIPSSKDSIKSYQSRWSSRAAATIHQLFDQWRQVALHLETNRDKVMRVYHILSQLSYHMISIMRNTKAYQSQVVEHSWTQTIGYPFPTFKPAAFRFLCIILLSFATLRLSHSDQTEKRRHQPSIAGLGCFFCPPLGFLDLCGLLAKCHTKLNHEQTSVKSVNSYTWQTDTPWAPHEPIWAPVKISQNQSE